MAKQPPFDIGDRVYLEAGFEAVKTGYPADPSTVTLVVMRPGDSTSIAVTPEQDATGVYHGDHEPDTAGTWTYRWAGTGDLVAAEEGTFTVRTRVVPDP